MKNEFHSNVTNDNVIMKNEFHINVTCDNVIMKIEFHIIKVISVCLSSNCTNK